MTTKSSAIHHLKPKSDVKRLINVMTIMAWLILGVGVLLCLVNLSYYKDHNIGLMVGIGFLIGSVHIYVIGIAFGIIHARARIHSEQAPQVIEEM